MFPSRLSASLYESLYRVHTVRAVRVSFVSSFARRAWVAMLGVCAFHFRATVNVTRRLIRAAARRHARLENVCQRAEIPNTKAS